MAYANLVAQGCINPHETFQRFRDFLCKRNGTYDYSSTGIGWTLHDAVYATDEDTLTSGDYFVAYSQGEDGDRELYFKFVYNTATNYVGVFSYLYWNSSTHTGTQEIGANGLWYNPVATNNIAWVYGDLDAVVGIAKYGSNYESTVFGWMPDSPIDQTISLATSGAITAGSSVTVSFASVPAGWAVGTYLFVADTANIERVEITGISGTDVTFDAFVASYAAAARFCLEITTFLCQNRSTISSYYLLVDHAGTKDMATTSHNWNIEVTGADAITGLYAAKKKYLDTTTGLYGPLKNQYTVHSTWTAETTHTIGAVGYRYFPLYSGNYTIVKEV